MSSARSAARPTCRQGADGAGGGNVAQEGHEGSVGRSRYRSPRPAEPAEVVAMLRKLRQHLTENADYVGGKFAEEARRIHYNEVEKRGIYGEATPRRRMRLAEEGIEFHPLRAARRPQLAICVAKGATATRFSRAAALPFDGGPDGPLNYRARPGATPASDLCGTVRKALGTMPATSGLRVSASHAARQIPCRFRGNSQFSPK